MNRLYAAAISLALIVGGLAALSGLDSCRRDTGHTQEIESATQHGEAATHAQAAESIPDHTAELAALEAETQRLRAKLAKIQSQPVVPPVVGPGLGEPDGALVDELRAKNAAQGELIEAQDRQIKGLELAYSDEQKRSGEFKAAWEHERKARQAQEAATEAWKNAVKASRWSGRLEGFAAGVALGYAGGRR